MIVFDLKCQNGHVFEGWFDSDEAFFDQKNMGLILCPICNDMDVEKIPSSFGIKKSTSAPPSPSPRDDDAAIAALSRKIYDFIETNFDNVGPDFAKEALKMHYGVAEPRNIRGVSSQAEEEMLKKEGVDIIKIPMPEKEEPNSDA